jgi:hypothetical protein
MNKRGGAAPQTAAPLATPGLSLVAFGVILLAYRVRAARGSQQIPSPTTGV